ncbi:MAG: hypothetical protein ACXU9O_00655 [Gemmatimonadaceae bacterium]
MRSVRSVLLLALLAMGCSGAEPFTGPATINGRWAEPFSIAGSFLGFELTSTGSTVTGSGNYAGEAGPFGTLAVAGTVDGIAVQLDLTFTEQAPRAGNTTTEHFHGQFTSANVIEGSIATDTLGQVPGKISYKRVN